MGTLKLASVSHGFAIDRVVAAGLNIEIIFSDIRAGMVENGHKQALADAIAEARAEKLKREQR
jgi:hypothetical protein